MNSDTYQITPDDRDKIETINCVVVNADLCGRWRAIATVMTFLGHMPQQQFAAVARRLAQYR